MDPLTALGLAGNIITFIDFATKLFKKTMEVYKTSEEILPDKQYRIRDLESDDGWKSRSGRQLLEEQLQDFMITTSKISGAGPKKATQLTFEVNEVVTSTHLQHFVGYSETLSPSGGLHRPPNVSATTVESMAEASNSIAKKMIDHLENMRKSARGKIWPS